MKFRTTLAVLAAVILSGCAGAPQLPVAVAPTAFTAPANKYGVVMAKLPVVDTSFPGAGCLLCYAAASVANSSLTTHTKTLQHDDLATLRDEVAGILKKKGASVKSIDAFDFASLPDNKDQKPNFARKDFTGLKAKHNVDKLLVINIASVGIERTYASYVPTSDPKAHVVGQSYIVNLNDNSLEWYQPVDASKVAEGKWDEPPKFPGLTNAYFQTLELAKDQITKPLAQ